MIGKCYARYLNCCIFELEFLVASNETISTKAKKKSKKNNFYPLWLEFLVEAKILFVLAKMLQSMQFFFSSLLNEKYIFRDLCTLSCSMKSIFVLYMTFAIKSISYIVA